MTRGRAAASCPAEDCDRHNRIGGYRTSLIATHGWWYVYVRCWYCDLKLRVGTRRALGRTMGPALEIANRVLDEEARRRADGWQPLRDLIAEVGGSR